MSISGSSDRAPLKRGLHQSTYESGLTAAYAALSAYYAARQGDGGAFIDISQVEAVTSELLLTVPEYVFLGAVSTRRNPVLDPFGGDPVPVDNGYVTVQVNTMLTVADYGKLLGSQELQDDTYESQAGRAQHAQDLVGALRNALAGMEPREFFERTASAGMLTGFSQTAGELISSPQMIARDVFVPMPGTLSGSPWQMPMRASSLTGTPAVYAKAAPALGENNSDALMQEVTR